MTDSTPKYALLHSAFNRLTKRCMVMTSADLFRWETWCSHGWTEADLSLVVAFINRRIKAKRRWPESLRLHNLIDTDRFALDLQDARGESRRPVETPRARALASIGRTEPQKDTVRTAGEILAAAKAYEDFRKFARGL